MPELTWHPNTQYPPHSEDRIPVLVYLRSGRYVACEYDADLGFVSTDGTPLGAILDWAIIPKPPPSWSRAGTYVISFTRGDQICTSVQESPEDARAYLVSALKCPPESVDRAGRIIDYVNQPWASVKCHTSHVTFIAAPE